MSSKKKRAQSGELELRRHFKGRRAGQRKTVDMTVLLWCPDTNLKARTVNLSRTGVLFHLTDDRFDGADGDGTFLYYSKIVQEHFANGSVVDFGDGVQRCIEIVRVTFGGLGGSAAPFLACRFQKPLSNSECSTLGVSSRRERSKAAG